MSETLNTPEKVARWISQAMELLERAKHTSFKAGRVDLAWELEGDIDRLKKRMESANSSPDTQTFSRALACRPPRKEAA
jgi:hypothetical protein